MSIIDPPKSRFLFGLIVGAAIAVIVIAVVEKLALRKQQTKAASYLLEGYDFSDLRSADNLWGGPRLGERINLGSLIGQTGVSLKDSIKEGPAMPVMIATINPSCGFCKIARDEMRYIQTEITQKQVRYYFVSFAPLGNDPEFYRFSESLKIGVPAFQWSKDATPPQLPLIKMAVPSHILIDREGLVLRVWPGTSGEQIVRESMGRQIVNDVSVIVETLDARTNQAAEPK